MIVVCGEALIDLFVDRSPGGALRTEAIAGGSPFNVARGLARLGRPAAYLASLSKDAFGQHLAERLSDAGVHLGLVRRVPNRTTLSVVATGPDGQPHYAFYDDGGADRALAPEHLPASLPAEATCIAAGSYVLAVEPFASAIEALLRRERGRRAASLDANVRPRVIGDLSAFRSRFERQIALATIVKASTEDLDLLYGDGADPAAIADDWRRRGPALVVVTRGPEGSTAYTPKGPVDEPARPVAVVDTVGAGDAFHAGFLAQLDASGLLDPAGLARLGRAEIARALETASAASALVCARRGAEGPTRAEVEALLGRSLDG
jgi:fructokinase